MVISGAGGHAKEILGIFKEIGFKHRIYFFDDVSEGCLTGIINKYQRLKTLDEAATVFKTDPEFVLGVGRPQLRKYMAEKLVGLGGKLSSVISPFAKIGSDAVYAVAGLNIMTGAVITQDVIIGKGSLVHIHVSVHHDSTIGDYCELSPGCRILGNVSVGHSTSVGAGAIILPGRTVGNNVIIGAGAVVTKDIKDGETVKGIPAR